MITSKAEEKKKRTKSQSLPRCAHWNDHKVLEIDFYLIDLLHFTLSMPIFIAIVVFFFFLLKQFSMWIHFIFLFCASSFISISIIFIWQKSLLIFCLYSAIKIFFCMLRFLYMSDDWGLFFLHFFFLIFLFYKFQWMFLIGSRALWYGSAFKLIQILTQILNIIYVLPFVTRSIFFNF